MCTINSLRTKLLLPLASFAALVATNTLAADRNTEAVAAQMRGDWRGLKAIATDWTKTDPRLAMPWIYLGIADDELGQTSEAIQAFEQGVARDSSMTMGWMYLAADYGKTGQSQKLSQAIEKLRAVNPAIAMMLQSQYPGARPSPSGQNAGAPSGVPQKAAAALARAKQWRGDAQLMMIELSDYANNGQFQTRFSFLSPSDHTGYVVADAGALSVGAENWGTTPIPARFLDLPAAVEQARSQGLQGPFNQALLRVGDNGLAWTITPTRETSTAQDPFLRRGAFQIPASLVSETAGPSTPETPIVPGKQIGAISLGMTEADVAKRLSETPECLGISFGGTDIGSSECKFKGAGLRITFDGPPGSALAGRSALTIEATSEVGPASRRYATDRGLKVGKSVKDVTSAYREPAKRTRSESGVTMMDYNRIGMMVLVDPSGAVEGIRIFKPE